MLELARGPSWKARSRSSLGTILPTNTAVDRAGIMQRIITPTNKSIVASVKWQQMALHQVMLQIKLL
jgi:hypothetical protein